MKYIDEKDRVIIAKVKAVEKLYIIVKDKATKDMIKVHRSYFPFNGKYIDVRSKVRIATTVIQLV